MRVVCRLCLVGLIFVVLHGCANPINRVTYQRYYGAGVAAEKSGQYEVARTNYYRALVNVKMGHLEPRLHAAAAYSLGRMDGILCDPKNAEILLKEALKYDRETSGPVYMALFELGLLKYAQEDYAGTAAYFSQALPLVDKEEYISSDPAQFAVYFAFYATALRKTGHEKEGESFSLRAKALSEQYPDAKPQAGITPYMKNCDKTPASGNVATPASTGEEERPES